MYYPIEITTCTALDVIQRSMTCHPPMLIELLEARAKSDRAYLAQGGHSSAAMRAINASAAATVRAIKAVESENVEAFAKDMGAGIIALNVACKLQCLPPWARTEIAIRTWES